MLALFQPTRLAEAEKCRGWYENLASALDLDILSSNVAKQNLGMVLTYLMAQCMPCSFAAH